VDEISLVSENSFRAKLPAQAGSGSLLHARETIMMFPVETGEGHIVSLPSGDSLFGSSIQKKLFASDVY